MSDTTNTKSFVELVKECGQIVVPQIQRDYAQGRDSARAVRESLLSALHEALSLPADDERLPLNLDFIYGSMEGDGERSFLPLDGQQRLTTLFLLHWYLAWRDRQLPRFRQLIWGGKHSRFSYQVRPSSTEFFDALVQFEPACQAQAVSAVKKFIEDQPWFFLYWRLDPTIQAALIMLDAMHERFKDAAGFYDRLVDETRPVITFQVLMLDHFGLSDDLYIKMNARGKPLTVFETFKAQFEEHLKLLYPTEHRRIDGRDVRVPMYFAMRMDTQWTDFFWHHKDTASDTFDDAVMNLLWALIRVSLDPNDRQFSTESMLLRSALVGVNFTSFQKRGWLTRMFADKLMCLLDAWSAGRSGLARQLPDGKYFDEVAFFRKAVKTPGALEYVELVQFAAFVTYLQCHEGNIAPAELQEWTRVVFNLTVNSGIDRPEDFGHALRGVQSLLPHSKRILQHLAETGVSPPGFSAQQIREEILKAQLIVADPGWRPRIDTAETHGYFKGQIEFLLEFAGIYTSSRQIPVSAWPANLHAELQGRFDDYLVKARRMFGPSGITSLQLPGKPFLWDRALLVCGDYLSVGRSNHSFLTSPAGNWNSWKRYLRGEVSGPSPRRDHLKTLWDRLDGAADIAPQLDQIIRERTGLEAWREQVVKHPQVIAYSESREIRRRLNVAEIYLLKKQQMNGAHAELFSFALYLDLDGTETREELKPLLLLPYQSVSNADVEPHVLLRHDVGGKRLDFTIESAGGAFRIWAGGDGLGSLPELRTMLRDDVGFSDGDLVMLRGCTREGVRDVLRALASKLASLPLANSTPPSGS